MLSMKYFILLFCLIFKAIEAVPEWQDLQCQPMHKYLFSDTKNTWLEAWAQCELYGGYLVHIGNQQEQNCLLKFGHGEGYKAWYWTDAHEVDTPGVYIHGSDSNEVTWFSPKIISYAGDAIMLGIFTDANKGAWYEYPSTSKQLFICEAQM